MVLVVSNWYDEGSCSWLDPTCRVTYNDIDSPCIDYLNKDDQRNLPGAVGIVSNIKL